MSKSSYYQILTAAFLLLSPALFAQRPIDELFNKYKKSPKAGMEFFELTEETKKLAVDNIPQVAPYIAYTTSASIKEGYQNIIDMKSVACTGKDAQVFYDEAIAFFDAQEGYTVNRTRLNGIRGKGYTRTTKDKNTGKTVKETNSVILHPPEEGESDGSYNACVMTIVTEENE